MTSKKITYLFLASIQRCIEDEGVRVIGRPFFILSMNDKASKKFGAFFCLNQLKKEEKNDIHQTES